MIVFVSDLVHYIIELTNIVFSLCILWKKLDGDRVLSGVHSLEACLCGTSVAMVGDIRATYIGLQITNVTQS